MPVPYLCGNRTWCHDDVIKLKKNPRYWLFVWWINRSPVNSPHKGQLRGAFTISFICAWTNNWVISRDACDLSRHRAHYDVTGKVLNGTWTSVGTELIKSQKCFVWASFSTNVSRKSLCQRSFEMASAKTCSVDIWVSTYSSKIRTKILIDRGISGISLKYVGQFYI